ncbi:hypothetical protein BH09MYX1_BH09MYX1_67380 [soil metagenome]
MTDIASDLKERLDYAAYFYLSAGEHDPEAVVDGNVIVRDKAKSDFEDQMIDTFERLRDSVDGIPLAILAKTELLRVKIGSENYDRTLGEAIAKVGRTSFPNTAKEFLETLNLSLEFSK